MTELQSYFFLLQAVFLCDTNLVIKTNMFCENLRKYKSRFSLIAEQILSFDLSTGLVREVRNFSPNFIQIT